MQKIENIILCTNFEIHNKFNFATKTVQFQALFVIQISKPKVIAPKRLLEITGVYI